MPATGFTNASSGTSYASAGRTRKSSLARFGELPSVLSALSALSTTSDPHSGHSASGTTTNRVTRSVSRSTRYAYGNRPGAGAAEVCAAITAASSVRREAHGPGGAPRLPCPRPEFQRLAHPPRPHGLPPAHQAAPAPGAAVGGERTDEGVVTVDVHRRGAGPRPGTRPGVRPRFRPRVGLCVRPRPGRAGRVTERRSGRALAVGRRSRYVRARELPDPHGEFVADTEGRDGGGRDVREARVGAETGRQRRGQRGEGGMRGVSNTNRTK